LENTDFRNVERGRSPENVINAAELVSWQWRPHTWLLWQMVPQGGVTLLAGETASGKSFLGLDLALGTASGRGRAWDMEIGDSSWLIADRESLQGRQEAKAAYHPLFRGGQGGEGIVGNAACLVPFNAHLTPASRNQPLAGLRLSTGEGLTYEPSAMSNKPVPSSPIPAPCKVRYFCSDADPNLIAERLLKLCRGYPTPTFGGTAPKNRPGIDVPTTLDLDFAAHQFSDPQSFRWLQKETDRQGYQLLIFDGLAQYLPAMADGSAPAVGIFLRGLRQLASQTGVTVLLIHQFNKRLASRTDKYGMPISQGEERVRGSSELLAGVDTALLLSRPEASALGVRAQTLLRVVKNRLGQAGARLRFSIVDGEPTNADGVAQNTLCQGASEVRSNSLHLLFERPADPAPVKPRRLVDAAFDEMMHILMRQDRQKFTRAELTKKLQERMNLPGSRTLAEAFGMLGKEERVRVERKENSWRLYSWATPGTGEMENIMYGLPPAMALGLASLYMVGKLRVNIADMQLEKLQNQSKPSELVERLVEFVKKTEEEEKKSEVKD